MSINKEVLRRAKERAFTTTTLRNGSGFLAKRLTGNSIEQNHLITHELTDYGLKENSIFLPPFIAIHDGFITILENPRSAQAINLAMTPMNGLLKVITGKEPLTNEEVIRNLKEERNNWKDNLYLNREKRRNPKSVHTIDWTGKIVE